MPIKLGEQRLHNVTAEAKRLATGRVRLLRRKSYWVCYSGRTQAAFYPAPKKKGRH